MLLPSVCFREKSSCWVMLACLKGHAEWAVVSFLLLRKALVVPYCEVFWPFFQVTNNKQIAGCNRSTLKLTNLFFKKKSRERNFLRIIRLDLYTPQHLGFIFPDLRTMGHPQPSVSTSSWISGFHWQQHQQRLPAKQRAEPSLFWSHPVLIEWHQKIEKPCDFVLKPGEICIYLRWISNDCTSICQVKQWNNVSLPNFKKKNADTPGASLLPPVNPHLHSIEIFLWSGPSHRNEMKSPPVFFRH